MRDAPLNLAAVTPLSLSIGQTTVWACGLSEVGPGEQCEVAGRG